MCPSGSHLCEDGCDASYWSLIGYTLKALQIVPTFVPMYMLISKNFVAGRRVISLACEDDCDARYWSLVGYSLKASQVVLGSTGASVYLVAMMVSNDQAGG